MIEVLIDPQILVSFGGVFRKHEKGQTIFYEGSPSQYYYQVLSGSVSIVNVHEDGSEFIQGMYNEGDCFGTAALFIDEPYPANAVAASDLVVIRLARDAFLSMLLERPELLLRVTVAISGKLHQKSCINKSMAIQGPEERITTLLNLLKRESGCAEHELYRLNLSRQQIADMIGLRVETVIRTIKRLEEKGFVSIEHGKVYY